MAEDSSPHAEATFKLHNIPWDSWQFILII